MEGKRIEGACANLTQAQNKLGSFRARAVQIHHGSRRGVFIGAYDVTDLPAAVWQAILRLTEVGLEENCQRAEDVLRGVITEEMRKNGATGTEQTDGGTAGEPGL